MFTGLIEEIGKVKWRRSSKDGVQFRVGASHITSDLRSGDSVAVNGCCLTVVRSGPRYVTFDLLQETLARTNLRILGTGSSVNLERALAVGGRMGGHFVQGHIDCTTRVIAFDAHGADYRLEVELAREFTRYAVPKGSIALNGVSLTIAERMPHSLVIWIVPHTRRQTNLGVLRTGDLVNVEFDLLAKYVERMLPHLTHRKSTRRSSRTSAPISRGRSKRTHKQAER